MTPFIVCVVYWCGSYVFWSDMASLRTRANEKIHYIASTTFTIDRCYTDLKLIGKGSYGVVCSALDMSKGKKVAIKKITPMAKTVADAKHVLREVRLMRYMGTDHFQQPSPHIIYFRKT